MSVLTFVQNIIWGIEWGMEKMLSVLILSLPSTDCGYGPHKYLVRLLTYLPGTTISEVTVTPQLLYEAGKTAATMDKFLHKVLW